MRRVTLFLRRHRPFLVLGVCLASWLWSIRGAWSLELTSVTTRYTYTRGWDHSSSSHTGLYSQQGALIVGRGLSGVECVAGMWFDHSGEQIRRTRHGPSIRLEAPRLDGGSSPPRFVYMSRYGVLSDRCGRDWLAERGFLIGKGYSQFGISVPWWFICVIASVPPARRLLRPALRRRRLRELRTRRHSHCPACGYDLRATPTRCPECGRAAAPLVAAS